MLDPMTITVTITATDFADLQAQLTSLLQPAATPLPTPAKTAANGQGEAVIDSPKKTAPGKKNAPAPKLTDVRRALTEYLGRTDEKRTAELLRVHGHVERLSELSESDFQAVYDAASAA